MSLMSLKLSNIKYEYLQKDFDATYMINYSIGIRIKSDYQVKEISISYTG